MIFKLEIKENEYFWGGAVGNGIEMPINKNSTYCHDFRQDAHNQFMPLFLSTQGRYVWSECSFSVRLENGVLIFEGDGDFELYEGGACLRDAYLHAMENHFPFKETRIENKTLPREFFRSAQFNGWVEFTYEPTQAGILEYAHSIIDNGFEPGILMIDEGWHTRYGQWKFDLHKFPDPRAMIEELHSLGFIVMLWVTPMVTADGVDFCKATGKLFNPKSYDKLFLRNKSGKVGLIEWWNGYSAILDLRKECDQKYLAERLDFLINEYGVDGFKFDGGSYCMYSPCSLINGEPAPDHDQTELNLAWNEFGAKYKFHEYKDTFKGGGKATIQRLCDREHTWEGGGINTLIPCSILQGLFGHPFICPDMIGGGQWTFNYKPGFQVDGELFVRMAQVSALFPMMQFSWAPWRVLDKYHAQMCLDAAGLHKKFAPYIVDLVKRSAVSGEPIVRHMEYAYPHAGYERVLDQFMLGEDVLVAPVIKKGQTKREVKLPQGKWKYLGKTEYTGGCTVTVDAPLEILPYFIKE